jgi:hypothetical protein
VRGVGRRAAGWDALLYAASAFYAGIAALTTTIPLFREWGRLAAGPYAVGALVALALPRRASVRARTWLAVAVFAGAAVAPLALETLWRSHTAVGLHAQSEVLVTEEGAKAGLDGRDPYATTYLHGSLAARPLATKTHFPYLPGMLAYGLPRAADGRGPLTDARVPFALVAMVAFALAARGLGQPAGRLRAAQFLLVLPTGALLISTGGDDLPVLALLLLALAMVDRDRPVSAGLAVGLAAATKQTAWLVVPFVLLAAARGSTRRRAASAAAAVIATVAVPFVAWNPAAFVEDAIRFPLGIGHQASAAGTPTLGSALVHAFGGERGIVVGLLILAVGALAAWLISRPGSRSPNGAARNAGLLFLGAVLLAPAARVGYLVYPINLLVWAGLLSGSRTGTVDHVRRSTAAGPL